MKINWTNFIIKMPLILFYLFYIMSASKVGDWTQSIFWLLLIFYVDYHLPTKEQSK